MIIIRELTQMMKEHPHLLHVNGNICRFAVELLLNSEELE
jgi:hypothetical protein